MYRLEHRRLPWVDVSAGGHAQPALQAGGKVGNDVTEHVVGHDYVEGPRVADHLGTKRVHVEVLGGDLRILFTYLLEYALPQASGVSHGVRLVAHENALARAPVLLLVAFAIFEGVADHALYTRSRVDVFLDCDLIRRALFEDAPGIDVRAFGVFADHDKVNVPGLDCFQRTQTRVQQVDRAHVMPRRISLAWIFEGTRGSPSAPNRIASKSRASMAKPLGGAVTPSAR